jgi:transposase
MPLHTALSTRFEPAQILLDTNFGQNRDWKKEMQILNEMNGASEIKRRSAGRKREVVLRLFRGEPVDALSREVSVPIYRLEQWCDRTLAGFDSGLKERENDPVEKQLYEAKRRIGELVMEVEIMRKERRAKRPLVGRRSSH